jgi:hypothetical protein
MNATHTPVPTDSLIVERFAVLNWGAAGDERSFWLVERTGSDGSYTPICKLDVAKAAPKLLAAIEGLLAEATGPAMVYGDGRGMDGTKTGLSHEEFNAQRKRRIEAARSALSDAKGGK